MPGNFQKTTDYTPIDLQNTYCSWDNITIVITKTESDHINYIIKCLKKINDHNLRINFQNDTLLKLKLNGLASYLLKRVFLH